MAFSLLSRKLCALCGLLAAPLLVSAVGFAGANTPEYSQMNDAISELGMTGAPQAMTMNLLGFGLVGMLVVAFAPGLHLSINGGSGSRLGPTLLGLSGLTWAAVGLAPGNLAEPSSMTWHLVLVAFSYVAGGLGLVMLVGRLVEDPYWRSFGRYTALAGLVTMGCLFTGELTAYPGLVQRALVAVYFLWIGILALRSLRQPAAATQTLAG